jgi:hypothetical protein
MTDEPGGERLLDIARAIASGERVAWPDSGSSGEEMALIDALRSLEGIAGAQRRLLDEAEQGGLTQWAHLAIVETRATGDGWTVYRARDAALARDVTLLLVGPLGGDPDVVARLLQQARRRTELHHPHLATAFGADYAQDRVGLWSAWLDGESLDRVLASQGPLLPHEAAAVGRDLSSATAALHQASLAHGAIETAAVTRTLDGRFVLQPWLSASPATFASDIAGLGRVLRSLAGLPAGRASAPARPLRRLERIADRAERADAADAFGSVEALDAELATVRPPAARGLEWMVGFGVTALVAALILWLTM